MLGVEFANMSIVCLDGHCEDEIRPERVVVVNYESCASSLLVRILRIIWILITEGANQIDQTSCITNNAKNTIAYDTEVQVQLCELCPDFELLLNALSFTGA